MKVKWCVWLTTVVGTKNIKQGPTRNPITPTQTPNWDGEIRNPFFFYFSMVHNCRQIICSMVVPHMPVPGSSCFIFFLKATGTTHRKKKEKQGTEKKEQELKKEQEGTGPGDPHVEPRGVGSQTLAPRRLVWFVLTCTRCGFPPLLYCSRRPFFVPTPFRTLLKTSHS